MAMVMIFWATGLWAFPITEGSAIVLNNPDKADLDKDWLVTGSFFFNQLRIIPQTTLIPTAPQPGTAVGTQARVGFRSDLNYDGKLDEFLPLPPPTYLGASFSPEQEQAVRMGSKPLAIPLPSIGSSSDPGIDYQLLLRCLSQSQNIYVVDAAAMARGEAGFVAQAGWGPGKASLPETDGKAGRVNRVPSLPTVWLAILLGGAVILWQWRSSRHSPNF